MSDGNEKSELAALPRWPLLEGLKEALSILPLMEYEVNLHI